MMQMVRSTWLVALVVFAFGCGSSKGGEGGSGGNGGGNGGDGGSSASGNMCEATCSSGDECESIACSCKDGSVVNSTSCNNGCCETEDATCPDACSSHGGWGSGGSGGEGGGSSGGAGFDEECSSNSDCDSGVCFYVDVDDENTQKCTINCSFGGDECPSGWDCAEVQGGAQTLCILQ